MKSLKAAAHERGFVLIVVYIVLVFVSIASIVLFARHQMAIQATERYQNRILAFNAAEAGIDFALRELSTNATRLSETANAPYTSPYVPLGQHGFRYVISPVLTGQAMFRRIDAEGCAPNCDAAARAHQESNIAVYASVTVPSPLPSLFQYGIYAKDSITLSGEKSSAFDSYNSNQGAYGGSNVNSEGAIAANTTGIGNISLEKTTVNGTVLVGSSGNPDTVITLKKATITQSKSNLAEDWELPPLPTLPETYTEIDLSNVTGPVAPLAPGTYHSTSIKITGNGTVPTTGTVKIYVDGTIDIAGNGITVPNNKPGNLHLYGTGSSDVKLSGNGSFIGGIYAPDSNVITSGNGSIFGAIVSKSFSSTGNSAFHFDLAMKENEAVDPSQTHIVRITAWQELNTLAWGTGS